MEVCVDRAISGSRMGRLRAAEVVQSSRMKRGIPGKDLWGSASASEHQVAYIKASFEFLE